MEPMTYNHGYSYGEQRIVAIEYHPCGKNGKLLPHSVFTTDADKPTIYCNTFDFDWCRRDSTLYFHLSGSGFGFYMHPLAEPETPPRCAVWWDANIVGPTNGGKLSKRILSARTIQRWGYDVLKEPLILFGDSRNPFDEGCNDDVEYCTRCRDHFPTENLCDHIWWCDKCGRYSAPQERCKHRRS